LQKVHTISYIAGKGYDTDYIRFSKYRIGTPFTVRNERQDTVFSFATEGRYGYGTYSAFT